MIKLVDVVYYYHPGFTTVQPLLDKQQPAFGFTDFINPSLDIQFVKHLNYTGLEKIHGRLYAFFKSRNRFWWIPFATHRYIKQQNPDIVMIEGLLFPLQLVFLRLALGKNCRFIARHHGEKPFRGIKGALQKLADKYIDAYVFTSYNNAADWVHKVIKDSNKCVEVLEASTYFSRKEKLKSQNITGITGLYNFLWVGRLISDKDPFTVLKAFEKYTLLQPDARLYMIYQDDNLLADVKKIISQSKILGQAVTLVGKVNNTDLADWYSAANFFISGSYREAAGYAILEAMACGCIPIVTTIPSFEKITENGKYGFLYMPGDVYALTTLLVAVNQINIDAYRLKIENYFKENLGFKKIAADIFDLCTQLHSIQR